MIGATLRLICLYYVYLSIIEVEITKFVMFLIGLTLPIHDTIAKV